MASTQVLKSRIRSVKSTKQITRAMQLVAASKMRRSQEATLASAPYADAARELLNELSTTNDVKRHPLFQKRPLTSRLLIVVASDKGLAGAYNSNVLRRYADEMKKDQVADIRTQTIAIGRRAAQFASRIKQTDILGVYENLADQVDEHQLYVILDSARKQFVSGDVDAVDIIYTKYINGIVQRVEVVSAFPAGFDVDAEQTAPARDVTYEPSTDEVLDAVVYRLVGAQLFQALLDARASEHSMRMVAMKNATDNASDLIDDLTLEMNKARQSAITQELAEISGGVEALNE